MSKSLGLQDYIKQLSGRVVLLQIMLPIVAHEHCVLQTEVMLITEVDK